MQKMYTFDVVKYFTNNQKKEVKKNMKKLSFVLAALLITGVAFGEKKCCKKGKAGKACCKKEASANVDGGNAANTVTLSSAAPAAPKACCKKGGEATKACCKKGEAGKACSKEKAAAAPAEAPATK
ncbi:MAG: hypothetical protein ORN55_06040 [Chitinophagaceae bacterium]|nr:hypothetical protein [Chitinophagaceae bacterium]